MVSIKELFDKRSEIVSAISALHPGAETEAARKLDEFVQVEDKILAMRPGSIADTQRQVIVAFDGKVNLDDSAPETILLKRAALELNYALT